MTGITIQEGKFYRCVDGQVIGPFKRNSIAPLSNPYQWRANDREWTYTCDGKLWVGYPSGFDLVEEVPNPNGAVEQEAVMTEPKFKVGDRVRRLSHASPDMDVGDEGIVVVAQGDECVRVRNNAGGVGFCHHAINLELVQPAPPSPIRTKTVKEIVPGVYGPIQVTGAYHSKRVTMRFRDNSIQTAVSIVGLDASELRDAARIFLELADALDGK